MRKSLTILVILLLALLPAGVLAVVNPVTCLQAGDCPVLSDQVPDQYRNLLNQENRTLVKEKLKTSVIEVDGQQYTVPQLIRQHQGILTRLGEIYAANRTGTCGDLCNQLGGATGIPVDCPENICQDLMRGNYLPLSEDRLYPDGSGIPFIHQAGMPAWGGSPALDGRIPRISAGHDEYLPYL
jgi:hypothetical protein